MPQLCCKTGLWYFGLPPRKLSIHPILLFLTEGGGSDHLQFHVVMGVSCITHLVAALVKAYQIMFLLLVIDVLFLVPLAIKRSVTVPE